MNSEIRKSYFLNKYAIIAPGRVRRPNNPTAKECPFCPTKINNEHILEKVTTGRHGKWQAIAVNNLFPAVSAENANAYGHQEVIIETPNHKKQPHQMSESDILAVLKLFSLRSRALSVDPKIDYILCFKNYGKEAGASQIHGHSQIFATRVTPEDLREESRLSHKYVKKHKNCPYCDIISREKSGERMIETNKYITAICPVASEYHYEAWIFSNRHADNINDLTDSELVAIAKMLKKIYIKLFKLKLPFNLFLHNVKSDNNQHFYIKIQPRSGFWGGVELGSGLIINSTSPEIAAKYYRNK